MNSQPPRWLIVPSTADAEVGVRDQWNRGRVATAILGEAAKVFEAVNFYTNFPSRRRWSLFDNLGACSDHLQKPVSSTPTSTGTPRLR